MESSVERTQRDYTLAFKLAVVEQVEKGRAHVQTGAAALRHPGSLDGSGLAAQARSPGLESCGISCSHVRISANVTDHFGAS